MAFLFMIIFSKKAIKNWPRNDPKMWFHRKSAGFGASINKWITKSFVGTLRNSDRDLKKSSRRRDFCAKMIFCKIFFVPKMDFFTFFSKSSINKRKSGRIKTSAFEHLLAFFRQVFAHFTLFSIFAIKKWLLRVDFWAHRRKWPAAAPSIKTLTHKCLLPIMVWRATKVEILWKKSNKFFKQNFYRSVEVRRLRPPLFRYEWSSVHSQGVEHGRGWCSESGQHAFARHFRHVYHGSKLLVPGKLCSGSDQHSDAEEAAVNVFW